MIPIVQLPDDRPGDVAGPTAREIEAWLVERLSRHLPAGEEVRLNDAFADLGLSSRDAVVVAGDLQAWLGRDVTPSLLFDHPTVAALSRHLGGRPAPPARRQAPGPEDTPIAVIGMGCRFPGARGPEAFWSVLQSGADAVTTRRHDPIPGEAAPGPRGRVPDVDRFDADFFGISAGEAAHMDPQQRLLLETAWETLENAAIVPSRVRGSTTGVFVGVSDVDYHRLGTATPAGSDAYSGTGQAASIAANRISYVFDLRGPSVTVDTACSSSLVAVHQACQALRAGEATMALAGGVNVILTGHVTEILDGAGMLSPGGRCRTFDANADGYVRAEGCGLVALKPLSAALADGDRVLAVLLGSAVNQDGHSNGLTAPNGLAQEAVLRAAYESAGVRPGMVGYVEAHGTGTPLGDPIEVRALSSVLGEGREAADPCRIGSVKTNIGHAEAAAGIAGLIKVVLMLEHDRIAPHLNLSTLNPRLALPDWLHVPTTAQEWPASSRPRVAGVSSFGFGGTNAHVVVADAAATRDGHASRPEPSHAHHLMVLSARDEADLAALAGRYADHIDRRPGIRVDDLCFTANTGREGFPRRAVLQAGDASHLGAQARRLSEGDVPPGTTLATTGEPGPLAFAFSGQGTQYSGMGHALYAQEPVYRRALDECAAISASRLPRPLLDVMFGDPAEGTIHQTLYAQPAIFATGYALARLWQSWGIEPDVVTGHSIGQIVAACVAGVLDLPDALSLVLRRAELMQARPPGAMLVALAPEDAVRAAVDGSEVDIAAVNSPTNTVVSGSRRAVDVVAARLSGLGIRTRPLTVSHAFHSRWMREVAGPLGETSAGIVHHRGRIPLVADLDGRVFEHDSWPDARYWQRHVHAPVRFSSVADRLAAMGVRHVLEIGARAALVAVLAEQLPEADVVPSWRRDQPEQEGLLDALTGLALAGHPVDWAGFHRHRSGAPISLPTYPFRRTRHWLPLPAAALSPQAAPERVSSVPAPASSVLDQVRALVAEMLDTTSGEIDPDRAFLELGADSILLIRALQAVRSRFDVELPISQLYENTNTPRLLADHIVRTAPPAPQPPGPDDPAGAVAGPGPAAGANATLTELLRVHQGVMNRVLDLLGSDAVSDGGGEPLHYAGTGSSAAPGTPAPLAATASPTPDAAPAEPPTRLTPEQRRHVEDLVARHARRTARSREHAVRERRTHADIRHAMSVPESLRQSRYPLVVSRSAGSRVQDVDGNEYVDLTMGFGVNFFGHGEEFIATAIKQRLAEGMQLGPQPSDAAELTELVCDMTGSERAVLCNTGSEAVMVALRLARAVTGRSRIALFAGSYHGSADPILVEGGAGGIGATTTVTRGVLDAVSDATLVLPYGTPAALDELRRHRHELAAVLVEPVQSRRPDLVPTGFLSEVRELLTESGTPLLLDEVITGFRMHPGGAQALLGVRADMAIYGKVVGGGLPIGVVAGDARYLDAVDGGRWNFDGPGHRPAERAFFSGTFCKHPLSLAAGLAVLKRMRAEGPALQQRLNDRTAALLDRLNAVFTAARVPIKAVGFGSLFRFRVEGEPPSWSETTEVFHLHLVENGIYVWEGRNCFLSTAHSDADLDRIVEAAERAVHAMRSGGFWADSPDPEAAAYPLSEVQREVWFLDRLGDEHSLAYTEIVTVRLRGELQQPALVESLREIVARHEGLRSVLRPDGSGQVPLPADRFSVDVVDLAEPDGGAGDRAGPDGSAGGRAGPDGASGADALAGWLEGEAERPFDLTRGPLLRLSLVRTAAEEHHLVLSAHHSVVDGWSFDIVLSELAQLYSAKVGGRSAVLPPAPRYRDHVKALAAAAGDRARRAGDEQYWADQFEDGIPVVRLPCDRPAPGTPTHRGASVAFTLSAHEERMVRDAAVRYGTTPFVLLLSAFALSLHRLDRTADIAIGVPVALRSHPGGDRVVGNCVNVVPIRSRTTSRSTVADLLQDVHRTLLRAHDHASFPLSALSGRPGFEGYAGRGQLLNVLFNLDRETEPPSMPGLGIEVIAPPRRYVKCDLFMDVRGSRSGLSASLEYNSDLFDEPTVLGFVDGYRAALSAVLADPGRRVARTSLLTESGRPAVRRGEPAQPAGDLCFAQLFERRAAGSPESTAVVSGDRAVTYGELNRRANRLAHHLIALGVGPEDRVGVLLGRSIEQVVGVLAVMKAGAAFVPADPDGPESRLEEMLADAGVSVVLADRPAAASGRTVVRPSDAGTNHPCEDPAPRSSPSNLCYVLYTSGSTGKPRGVMVTHANLTAAYAGWERVYRLREDVRTHLQLADPTFDVYVGDLARALLSGGTLVICPRETLLRPERLYALMRSHRIDIAEFVPAVLRGLVRHVSAAGARMDFMKILVVGSDVMKSGELAEVAGSVGTDTLIVNSYGLTEATIDSTWHRHGPADSAPGSLVGVPLDGVDVFVLDEDGRPVPVGAVGTLHIGGTGVARGYLGDPAATAVRYKPNPWSAAPGGRMYDTGDLARLRRHGTGLTVELLGRADDQVKIRGNRLDTAEVEARLRGLSGVRDAAVTVASGSSRLTAHVVLAEDGGEEQRRDWYRRLRAALPLYMLPERFVALPALPQLASGKVDRRALASARGTEFTLRGREVAARNEVERVLSETWSEVLGTAVASVHDEFFALGGHSLSAVQFLATVHETFGVEIGLARFFACPTIAATAEEIERLRGESVASVPLRAVARSPGAELPLLAAQRQFWASENMWPGTPLYSICSVATLRGPLDRRALRGALQDLIDRHDVLRGVVGVRAGRPAMRVREHAELTVPEIDLTGLPDVARPRKAAELARQHAHRGFDLGSGPLVHVSLIRLAPAEHQLLINVHHVAADYWSLDVLLREFRRAYAARLLGRRAELEPVRAQAADAAEWHERYLAAGLSDTQLTFWKSTLEDMPKGGGLPADFTVTDEWSVDAGHERFTIDPQLTGRIDELAKELGVTRFVVLLAALYVVLLEAGGEPDLVVGSPVTYRPRPEMQSMVGPLINTLALRTDLGGDPSLQEVVDRVQTTCLAAYANQDVPFDQVAAVVDGSRTGDRRPLFSVMFQYLADPVSEFDMAGVEVSFKEVKTDYVQFDLLFEMAGGAGGIECGTRYRAAMYRPSTIRRAHLAWRTVLTELTQNRDARMSAVVARLAGLTEAPQARPSTRTDHAQGASR
ncbi:amino acid adenylation domain-containing protein [Nonomuraea deserti]|uniref:Amino acid adenylation domain-containing protein n=1 Tax=Nonomuraea deserti TaxID=1848322 RepID=A0A4R4V9X8_9ACTN|nr:non-ribosomal peptide synthetase/type I polyketide synthase [Nonomuraea deserti]TDD01521.1 amino acid adenylation domain-containing protein [Nonomuraea deserti]